MLRLQKMGLMDEKRQEQRLLYWQAERDRLDREMCREMHKIYEELDQKNLAEKEANKLTTRIRKWWDRLFPKDTSIPCGIGIDYWEDLPPGDQ